MDKFDFIELFITLFTNLARLCGLCVILIEGGCLMPIKSFQNEEVCKLYLKMMSACYYDLRAPRLWSFPMLDSEISHPLCTSIQSLGRYLTSSGPSGRAALWNTIAHTMFHLVFGDELSNEYIFFPVMYFRSTMFIDWYFAVSNPEYTEEHKLYPSIMHQRFEGSPLFSIKPELRDFFSNVCDVKSINIAVAELYCALYEWECTLRAALHGSRNWRNMIFVESVSPEKFPLLQCYPNIEESQDFFNQDFFDQIKDKILSILDPSYVASYNGFDLVDSLDVHS